MPNISKLIRRVANGAEFRLNRILDGIRRKARVSFPRKLAAEVSCVEQLSSESDGEYDLYQKYYENCLREVVCFKKTNSPALFAPHATHVGQYIFRLKSGKVIKVAIDAHDHRNIRSQDIFEWSDIYFKSNRWPTMDYDPKVLPIPTGNAGITLENCRFLRGLRSVKKELDLVFVGRIWAGGDANVEHNLRLFESLAKVNCKSKLLAVVFNFDRNSQEFLEISSRLDKAGVEWTENQICYGELMRLSAMSKLVVLRAGISGCIAWRMVDMLAIGAAIVLDRSPFPEWPVPLKEGDNFLSLGLRITTDCKPAPLSEYEKVAGLVSNILNEQKSIDRISLNNSEFFENFFVHTKISKYIINILLCEL